MKIFKKVKKEDGQRDFYLFGIKIFSYIKKLTEFQKLYLTRFDENISFETKKEILSKLFFKCMGYQLNLENPKTFSEKLQWLKLFYQKSIITKCADKIGGRDYFVEKISNGNDHLVKALGVYNNPDEIDFDQLPNQFVLKSNWGSGSQIIVKDKSSLDIKSAKEDMKNWLKREANLYFYSFEYGYKNIVPKIMAEELLDFEYKMEFFCFNGEPKFLWTVFDDKTKHTKANFYDFNWKQIPIYHKYKNLEFELQKPEYFDEMQEKAKILCGGFPFVRVDFYKTKNGYRFSEMTFFHWAGLMKFTPEKYDLEFGNMLKLPDKKIVE